MSQPRDELNWYEKSRCSDGGSHHQRTLRGFEPLEDLGAEVIQFSTVEIVPPENWDELDRAIDKIESYDWLIFTSSNGVDYFFRRFSKRQGHPRTEGSKDMRHRDKDRFLDKKSASG
jgi:hypothetical protein